MTERNAFGARERSRRIAWMGLFAALGTVSAHLIGVPVGMARVFPVQHAINVVAGAVLGPGPAVLVALVVSLLRNVLGLGTLFAFPGSVFGAWLAGAAYRAAGRPWAAAAGEVAGTGIVGALAAFAMARLLLGQEAAAITFVGSFAASSVAGAVLGLAVLGALGYGARPGGKGGLS